MIYRTHKRNEEGTVLLNMIHNTEGSWSGNHSSGSSVWLQEGKSTLDEVFISINGKEKC